MFITKNACRPLFKNYWLLALLLTACGGEHSTQSILMDMSYHDARKIILQSGWQPALNMPPYETISASGHYFRDLGYEEVEDCTGSSILQCTFYFQNAKGQYLRIGTEGEYEDPHVGWHTRIIYAAIQSDID